ncbi:MAG: hypothetical protein ABFS18_01750 [Thermodesulfobacteriota bacterium]
MFSEMIEMLKRGELPSAEKLHIRLKPAMVKKGGVMQQPHPCWSNDPKINPDSGHMLWAAILLEDQELISMATAMMFVEQGNKLDALTPQKARKLLTEKGSELLALAPTPEFKSVLAEKINTAVTSFCLK